MTLIRRPSTCMSVCNVWVCVLLPACVANWCCLTERQSVAEGYCLTLSDSVFVRWVLSYEVCLSLSDGCCLTKCVCLWPMGAVLRNVSVCGRRVLSDGLAGAV